MKKISLHETSLLLDFYLRAQRTRGGGVYADSVDEVLPHIHPSKAALTLGRLERQGYVERMGFGHEHRAVYRITDEGKAHIEDALEEDPDAFDNLFEATNEQSLVSQTPQPDIDDTWEPLPIDLGNKETQNLINNFEQAIETVRSDNGYAALHPIDRAEVLSRLNGFVDYVKNAPALTSSAIQVYVIWPVEKLVKQFEPKTAVMIAVNLAVSTLKEWIKKRGGDLLDGIFK